MEAGVSIKSLLEQAVKQLAKVEDSAILTFSEGKGDAVKITDEDFRSLQPLSSLSSNIVDFCLKYLAEVKIATTFRDRFYFFNSTFFKTLVGTRSASDDIDYDKVRNVTGEVDLFQKDYIFIPIHDDMHWSLIIIFNLSILRIPHVDEHRVLPRILHLDSYDRSLSLDSNVKRQTKLPGQRVVRYIFSAWKERHPNYSVDQLLAISQLNQAEVKVAQLDNEFDSGIYLLKCAEILVEKAVDEIRVPCFTERMGEASPPCFDFSEASAKRIHIKNLILSLSGMTSVQLDLRFHYSEILSWLKGRDDELMDETAQKAQHGTEVVHVSQQADGEVVPHNGHRQQHGKKRMNFGVNSDIVRKDRRVRTRNWSEKESLVLLRCVAEGKFLKGKFADWDLISEVIYKEVGSNRSRTECQGRFDTLWKTYTALRNKERTSGIDNGSQEWLDVSYSGKMSGTLPAEWRRFLDIHWKRKELGKRAVPTSGGSSSLPSSTARTSPLRSSNEHSALNLWYASDLQFVNEIFPSPPSDPFQAKAGSPPLPHGIYQRSVKNKSGQIIQAKFEPRLRPPKENSESERPNYLYFGQYDTVEEATAVYHIAAFYYGMSDNRFDLGDNHYFIIPPLSPEEFLLSGEKKREFVKQKVRRVYEEAKAEMMGLSLRMGIQPHSQEV